MNKDKKARLQKTLYKLVTKCVEAYEEYEQARRPTQGPTLAERASLYIDEIKDPPPSFHPSIPAERALIFLLEQFQEEHK